jgi:aquaporin NIP
VRPDSLVAKSIAEGIGTFAMVFMGCGAIRVLEKFPGSLPSGAAPVIFGLIVAVMIYTLGHLSGAHFNPAVTLAFAIAKRFPLRQVGAYWFSQFAGAFLATGLLSLLVPDSTSFGAATSRLSPWQTFGWEMILTFFLMLVIIAVATDSRAEGTMAGAAIGGMVTVGALVGGPVTGAAMNPARYLAPAFAEGKLELWWVYLAGAFIGAALAAVLYEKIRCESLTDKNAQGCC